MSVFGGDSWAREAQHRKRRVEDLALEAHDDTSSYKKLPSGKYVCLLCPHSPILDSPLMLSVRISPHPLIPRFPPIPNLLFKFRFLIFILNFDSFAIFTWWVCLKIVVIYMIILFSSVIIHVVQLGMVRRVIRQLRKLHQWFSINFNLT